MTFRDIAVAAAEGGGAQEGVPWWWYPIGAPILALVILGIRKILKLEDWPPGSGKTTQGAQPGPDTQATEPRRDTPQAEATERYDQKMVLIERYINDQDERLDKLEETRQKLEAANMELSQQLAEARTERDRLRWMFEQWAGRPMQYPGQLPPWPNTPPPGSPPGP